MGDSGGASASTSEMVFELKRVRFPPTLCSDHFAPSRNNSRGAAKAAKKGEKWIVPIVLQNENGPCPLLAVANVLLLRRCITIHEDLARIAHDDLVQRVAEYLTEDVVPFLASVGSDVDTAAANVHEAIELLPKMDQGLDLNVRFTHINDLEATRECALFDVLGIDLVHGWIVPAHSDVASVVGKLSYNQLVDAIIEGRAAEEKEEAAPGAGGEESGSDSEPAAEAPDDPDNNNDNSPLTVPRMVATAGGESSDEESSDGAIDLATRTSLLQSWLDSTPEQLTAEGLKQLRSSLRPGQLSVLFRGSHFSVLLRHDDEKTGEPRIYSLVTDCGYRSFGSVVWERLDGVGNNTQLCDSRFRPGGHDESDAVTQSLLASTATTTPTSALAESAPACVSHDGSEGLLGLSQEQIDEQHMLEREIELVRSQEQEATDRQLALEMQAQLDRADQAAARDAQERDAARNSPHRQGRTGHQPPRQSGGRPRRRSDGARRQPKRSEPAPKNSTEDKKCVVM
jgi:MINDY deubiquitinase